MIAWKQHCKTDTTLLSDRKIWESKCNEYKVIFSHIRFGEKSQNPIPDTYYAIEVDERGGTIISKHRKKSTAMKACDDRDKKKSS